MLGLGLVLVGRAAELQLSSRSEREAAHLTAERTRTMHVAVHRGRILDAHGRVLAEDRVEHDVKASLELLRSTPARAEVVAALDLDAAESCALESKVRELAKRNGDRSIVVKRAASEPVVARVRALRRRGLTIEDTIRRHYPLGATVGHYLGHVGQGATPADRVGRSGVERAFDSSLSGTSGARVVPSTSWIRGEAIRTTSPRDGDDLALTIDAKLSREAANILERSGIRQGALVVIDPRDGSVLTSISVPAIDSNPRSRSARTFGTESPWVDRTRQDGQAPGALVFPFEVLAERERGVGTPKETCRGFALFEKRIFHCTHLHGSVTATSALEQHCNVYFYRNAQTFGLAGMNQALRSAGMIGPVGMALGEPASAFPLYEHDERLAAMMSLPASVGQGQVRTTPLGVAVAYAALGNGGRVLAPRVLGADPIVERGVLPSRDALGSIRDALEKSAQRYDAPAHVAGTVAAGQRKDGADVRWFAGFAPALAPRVVVVVLSETAATSAEVAATGYQIIEAALGDGETERP